MDEIIKNGTGLKNKRTGQLACINDQFPHNGDDTNWLMVTCYHICLIGKNRYKYVNHDDLIKNWEVLTERDYWIAYNKFYGYNEDGKK